MACTIIGCRCLNTPNSLVIKTTGVSFSEFTEANYKPIDFDGILQEIYARRFNAVAVRARREARLRDCRAFYAFYKRTGNEKYMEEYRKEGEYLKSKLEA